MADNLNDCIMKDQALDLSYHVNKYIHESDIETHPLDMLSIDSKYYDISDILPLEISHMNFQTKAMHLNIQGLNAKFDELKFLLAQLSEKNIKLDCILVCETFINCHNEQLFN